MISLDKNLPGAVVHVILTRTIGGETEVLLLRRANTGRGDGTWAPPAGRVEEDESLRHAAMREVREEVGLVIEGEDLNAFGDHIAIETDGRHHVFIMANRWSGEPMNMEPDRADGVSWWPIDKLPAPIVEHVREVLLRAVHSQATKTLLSAVTERDSSGSERR